MTAMRWFSITRLDHDVGALEHVALLAGRDGGCEVRTQLLELLRCVGCERGLGIDDRGQRVVLHDDGLGRVGSGGSCRRDDHRDRVADEADLVGRERRPQDLGVELHQPFVERQAEIRGREDGHDTRHRPGLVGVNRHDARVRVRRAHEVQMQDPVDRQVVDELGASDEEVRVFDAPYSGSENRSGHVSDPSEAHGRFRSTRRSSVAG